MSSFTPQEKRKFKLTKFIKDHWFEWAAEAACTCLFVWVLLKVCGAAKMSLGMVLALVYCLFKVVYEIACYTKGYLSDFDRNK